MAPEAAECAPVSLRPRWKGSTLQMRSYSSTSIFHKSAPCCMAQNTNNQKRFPSVSSHHG
eukprot:1176542-Prorocentrum_minimum.AAC.3